VIPVRGCGVGVVGSCRTGLTAGRLSHPLIVHATKAILDQWGQDGWELVQVLQSETGLVAYLKRPTGEK
jgi:hypothetical protein